MSAVDIPTVLSNGAGMRGGSVGQERGEEGGSGIEVVR